MILVLILVLVIVFVLVFVLLEARGTTSQEYDQPEVPEGRRKKKKKKMKKKMKKKKKELESRESLRKGRNYVSCFLFFIDFGSKITRK